MCFGRKRRASQNRREVWKNGILGFIEAKGPRENVRNQLLRWVTVQATSRDSPIYRWPQALVAKSLRNLGQDGVLAQVHELWPLTLYLPAQDDCQDKFSKAMSVPFVRKLPMDVAARISSLASDGWGRSQPHPPTGKCALVPSRTAANQTTAMYILSFSCLNVCRTRQYLPKKELSYVR